MSQCDVVGSMPNQEEEGSAHSLRISSSSSLEIKGGMRRCSSISSWKMGTWGVRINGGVECR